MDSIGAEYSASRRLDPPGRGYFKPTKPRGRPSCGDPEAFAALYREGETVAAIAAAFGCTPATVRTKLHFARVEFRQHPDPRPRKNADRDASIRARFASGEAASAIARDVGLNPVYIYEILGSIRKPSRKGFRRTSGSVVPAAV